MDANVSRSAVEKLAASVRKSLDNLDSGELGGLSAQMREAIDLLETYSKNPHLDNAVAGPLGYASTYGLETLAGKANHYCLSLTKRPENEYQHPIYGAAHAMSQSKSDIARAEGWPDEMAMRVIDPDQWEPCSPSWLERGGDCGCAPRVWNANDHNHWHPKIRSMPERAVEVVELTWTESGTTIRAEMLGLRYHINPSPMIDHFKLDTPDGHWYYPTIEAAKEAAKADLDKRINQVLVKKPTQASMTREQQIVAMADVLTECPWFKPEAKEAPWIKEAVWATRLWDAANPTQAASEDQSAKRLYNGAAPMADGDTVMTAAESVLAFLLIEKIGVPDDVPYTPDQAQDIIIKKLGEASGPEVVCTMQTMTTSAGKEYYVHLRRGDLEMTPESYEIKGRAELGVAEWKYFFGQADEPDILAYDTETETSKIG